MIDARPRRAARASLAAATFAAALIVIGLALPPTPANAAEPATKSGTAVGTPTTGGRETSLVRIQRMVARLNQEAATPEGEAAVVARLSKQLRTSPDTLRTQHSAWGLGYGEVAMAYGFARGSRKPGVTPEQVVTMRREGKSWEMIAKELGVKVDAVASRMT
ncbi:MAG TPA: hypothetical protein VFU59_05630, partial [Candidatus Eisenbacteria bacterium]|nr:hypothetical protein [Candidatus Eisenbacteria bacterium]